MMMSHDDGAGPAPGSHANRRRGTPAYLALADAMSRLIATLPPGSKLPSENEIAAEHGISHMTARNVLLELERRHLVRRVRGSGTYVARRIEYKVHMGMPYHWSEVVRQAGSEPFRRVISASRRRPPAAVRTGLGLRANQHAIVIVQVCSVDGLVAHHATHWFPPDLAPAVETTQSGGDTLYEALVDFGLEPVPAWATAELDVVPSDIAPHLELEDRPMLWHMIYGGHDKQAGRPISYNETWLRTDVYNVKVMLGSPPEQKR